MRHVALLAAAFGCLLLAPDGASADSACDRRIGVGQNETLGSIAQRCGVNVEALKQANPGLQAGRPHAGTYVVVPARPLPTPPIEMRGNPAMSSSTGNVQSRDPGIALRKTYPGTLADRQPRPKVVRPQPPSNKPWERPKPLWAPADPAWMQNGIQAR